MSDPLSLCIEDLDELPERVRFIRCVALCGSEPGLAIDVRGKPLWKGGADAERACELCVSGDGKLILWRLPGAPPIEVRRAHRTLDAPSEKVVILLDQDELSLVGVHLRLHVHGPTKEIHPPTPLLPRALGTAAVAAAVAMGVTAAGCRADESASVSAEQTTAASAQLETGTASASESAAATTSASAPSSASTSAASATASASAKASASGKVPPIRVRPSPPRMAPPD